MIKLIITLLFFLICSVFYAQNNALNEGQKQRIEQKMEDRKQEYIANFLFTLDVDEFQKEIIKQKLETFFDEKMLIYKKPFKRTVEFEEAVRNLEQTHFKDIKEMVTEDTMSKIIEMAQGDFNEKEVIKDKKRKRKKKN